MEEDNKMARRWCLTINNPKESDEEMLEYVKALEHFKYVIFSREKGHEKETEHFQMFIIFSVGKRFSTIKNYFPTAHIEKAQGSNVQAREYCTKSDTHISGPFEFGKFSEERARTDIQSFYELLDSGASNMVLRELFPSLFLREFNKLQNLRTMSKAEIYKKQERDIEVIFIYGPSGSGKTTYVRDLIRNENYFYVDTFDNSAFTGYANEDILVIDEFKGQFNIQFMNRLLDFAPVKLRGLNFIGQACFTKVYILSNYSYKSLYKEEQVENVAQYKGFVRRLHKVIRISEGFKINIERETYFEDIPESEQKPYGRKKQISKIVEYNNFNVPSLVYDRHKACQLELTELSEEEKDNLPF